MKTFQFYVKQDAVLPLDIDDPNYSEEKAQLVEQGFELVGDLVQAETSAQAFEKFKTSDLEELAGFAGWHLVTGGIGAILGFTSA
ncbi:hypothetical protein [Motilimonas sp. KMU-193]|uniref:hypothetical protein n=1 Tax=Motilimonas sp. KMU-193 TaxID=3388668 RepID=UPI00396B074E